MVMADWGDRDRATFARRKHFRKDHDYEDDVGSRNMRPQRNNFGDRSNYENPGSAAQAGIIKIPKILTKPSTAANQEGKPSTGVGGSASGSSQVGGSASVTLLNNSHVARNDNTERNEALPPAISGLASAGGVKPMALLRKDNNNGGEGAAVLNHSAVKAGHVQQVESSTSGRQHQQEVAKASDDIRSRLQLPPTTRRSIKLVDEALNWCDGPLELLLDQTNFLVIGCLGKQGAGKSLVMSHLATNARNLSPKMFGFRQQNKDVRDCCTHMTVGIDLSVTQERTILLDTQALMSFSIQDSVGHTENKYSTDFSVAENNSIEIQSMQIATFMMTVCHVIVVVAEDFNDINFIRLLRMAEMLKPTTPNQKNPMAGYDEYYPFIVFVQNKSEAQDFSKLSIHRLDKLIQISLLGSQLIYRGMPGMSSVYVPSTKKPEAPGWKKVPGSNGVSLFSNIFVLPVKKLESQANKYDDAGRLTSLTSVGYRGSPGFDDVMGELRRQLLSVPRHNLTHTTLSEKNWFHYAARTWDVVRKQQQLAEYTRLLS